MVALSKSHFKSSFIVNVHNHNQLFAINNKKLLYVMIIPATDVKSQQMFFMFHIKSCLYIIIMLLL